MTRERLPPVSVKEGERALGFRASVAFRTRVVLNEVGFAIDVSDRLVS